MKAFKQYFNKYILDNLGATYQIDFGQGLNTTSLDKYIGVYYSDEYIDDIATGDVTGQSVKGKQIRQLVVIDLYARDGVYSLDDMRDAVWNALLKKNKITLDNGLTVEITDRNFNVVERTNWHYGAITFIAKYIETV
ncbi:hypothetical protein [Kosmotoga pacifica]|uniref:Phage protein n=1 Tax=Kosmotoga pacifica TaxID=1330330 RepID=A0A0G2ZCU8_9BACT|nr:hypothetical protein [Kosmotoga pacifica]AKI96583.1 hypothetical protein IX53_00715 [Kosmotoga pacifica]